MSQRQAAHTKNNLPLFFCTHTHTASNFLSSHHANFLSKETEEDCVIWRWPFISTFDPEPAVWARVVRVKSTDWWHLSITVKYDKSVLRQKAKKIVLVSLFWCYQISNPGCRCTHHILCRFTSHIPCIP